MRLVRVLLVLALLFSLLIVPAPATAATSCRTIGRVLVLAANVKQFTLDSTRVQNFAVRVRRLANKAEYEYTDGMGCWPDVIVLQEIYNDVTDDVRNALNMEFTGTTASPYAIAKHFSPPATPSGGKLLVADSAILYNTSTMDLLGTSYIDTAYSKEEGCVDSILKDADGDGFDDCDYVKTKRHATALLEERVRISGTSTDPVKVAVASIHLVPSYLLKDDTTAELKKTQWSTELAEKLAVLHPGANSFSLAGDFNRTRCIPGTLVPSTGYKETTVCGVRPFWDALQAQDMLDSIFAVHGATNESLDGQYRDGYTKRPKRIDFIFARGANVLDSASHDLTCGVISASDCQSSTSPERYSDHRLLWAFLGPVPRAAAI